MDQLTLSATATYGSDTITGSVAITAKEVQQGVLTATNTYAAVLSAVEPFQAVLFTNGGAVDVSVRLTFASTQYAFFTVPSGCTVALPRLINVNSATPDGVEAVHVRTVSGTAEVTYIVVL
jgi:hypothetical protein